MPPRRRPHQPDTPPLCPLTTAAARADLDGTWVAGASPAALLTNNSTGLPTVCKCAPDPLLPDPNCILCLCDVAQSGVPSNDDAKKKIKKGCGLTDATKAVLKYETGAVSGCACAKDPFLAADQWIMCECPGAAGCSGKPLPEIAPQIPTIATYTAWPVPPDSRQSPPTTNWPICASQFALCSFANCTLAFPFKSLSSIPLAECGCVENGVGNNLTAVSYVSGHRAGASCSVAVLVPTRLGLNTQLEQHGCFRGQQAIVSSHRPWPLPPTLTFELPNTNTCTLTRLHPATAT